MSELTRGLRRWLTGKALAVLAGRPEFRPQASTENLQLSVIPAHQGHREIPGASWPASLVQQQIPSSVRKSISHSKAGETTQRQRAGCSSRGPRFDSHHLHDSSQQIQHPLWLLWAPGPHGVHRHKRRQNSHTHKISTLCMCV